MQRTPAEHEGVGVAQSQAETAAGQIHATRKQSQPPHPRRQKQRHSSPLMRRNARQSSPRLRHTRRSVKRLRRYSSAHSAPLSVICRGFRRFARHVCLLRAHQGWRRPARAHKPARLRRTCHRCAAMGYTDNRSGGEKQLLDRSHQEEELWH